MTIGFIFAALAIDWILCEFLPITREAFWLDDLIEDQNPE